MHLLIIPSGNNNSLVLEDMSKPVKTWKLAPQDSVLVPILFLTYINYLQNNTSIDILKFADYIILYKLLKKLYDISNFDKKFKKY